MNMTSRSTQKKYTASALATHYSTDPNRLYYFLYGPR